MAYYMYMQYQYVHVRVHVPVPVCTLYNVHSTVLRVHVVDIHVYILLHSKTSHLLLPHHNTCTCTCTCMSRSDPAVLNNQPISSGKDEWGPVLIHVHCTFTQRALGCMYTCAHQRTGCVQYMLYGHVHVHVHVYYSIQLYARAPVHECTCTCTCVLLPSLPPLILLSWLPSPTVPSLWFPSSAYCLSLLPFCLPPLFHSVPVLFPPPLCDAGLTCP